MTDTITLRDADAAADVVFAVATIREIDGARICRATADIDGLEIDMPVVVYATGEVVAPRDWQAPRLSDQDIIDDAADPRLAHHWVGSNGQPCVIVGGLPRCF